MCRKRTVFPQRIVKVSANWDAQCCFWAERSPSLLANTARSGEESSTWAPRREQCCLWAKMLTYFGKKTVRFRQIIPLELFIPFSSAVRRNESILPCIGLVSI